MWFVSCHATSVLRLVAVLAIYNFAPHLRGIRSCVEFHDALCGCKLGAAKYGKRVGPGNQLQLSGLAPLPHIWKLQPSRCSLRLQVHFWVDSFLLSGQNVTYMYTWFCSAIWLVPPKQGGGSWQLFPWMLLGSLLPPFFEERAWGQGYTNTGMTGCILLTQWNCTWHTAVMLITSFTYNKYENLQ